MLRSLAVGYKERSHCVGLAARLLSKAKKPQLWVMKVAHINPTGVHLFFTFQDVLLG